MANRTTFSDVSAPPVPGGGPTGFLAEYAERMKQLFDACALPLTGIGGTANAVTASLDPLLDGSGLVDGMKFTLTFGTANTGSMTLAINGGSALPIVDKAGTALVAGAVAPGMRALIEYIGGQFRVLTELLADAAGGAGPYAITITASTTWNRPPGYDADTLVRIQAWGGGGGGASASGINHASGGGGGGYVERMMRYADVPASVACTIGAGGAAGAPGGTTTFGSLLTARPGASAGGGGGELTAGTSGAAGTGGGSTGGGHRGSGPAADARSTWGGGGGGGATGAPAGGNAVFGGGGGGAKDNSSGAGGTSLFGGNGGNGNAGGTGGAGTAPGGGGGGGLTGGAGARGEIRIQILG